MEHPCTGGVAIQLHRDDKFRSAQCLALRQQGLTTTNELETHAVLIGGLLLILRDAIRPGLRQQHRQDVQIADVQTATRSRGPLLGSAAPLRIAGGPAPTV